MMNTTLFLIAVGIIFVMMSRIRRNSCFAPVQASTTNTRRATFPFGWILMMEGAQPSMPQRDEKGHFIGKDGSCKKGTSSVIKKARLLLKQAELGFCAEDYCKLGDEAFADEDFLIGGSFLKKGQIMVLVGPSGSGKSTFLADLVMKVSRGIPFWGGRRTSKGKILLYVGEDLNGVLYRLNVLAKKLNINLDEKQIIIKTKLLDLGNDADMIEVDQDIKKWKPVIVAFDTFTMFFRGDENSAQDISDLYVNLRSTCTKTGVAIILVHHTGKNADSGPRGSSAITANADVVYTVTSKAVEPGSMAMTVSNTKNKNSRHIDPIELIADDSGCTVTTKAGEKITALVLKEAAK